MSVEEDLREMARQANRPSASDQHFFRCSMAELEKMEPRLHLELKRHHPDWDPRDWIEIRSGEPIKRLKDMG